MKELLAMKIRKIKYGFYSIIKDGKEIAVASSFSEANRMIRKLIKKAGETR